MWFDAQAELAKLGGEREQDRRPLATTATSATLAPRVANVASVATPSAPEITSHGQTAGGRVTTWTGRVVSLDEWRGLTAWQRHGPNGRLWCGTASTWKLMKGDWHDEIT